MRNVPGIFHLDDRNFVASQPGSERSPALQPRRLPLLLPRLFPFPLPPRPGFHGLSRFHGGSHGFQGSRSLFVAHDLRYIKVALVPSLPSPTPTTPRFAFLFLPLFRTSSAECTSPRPGPGWATSRRRGPGRTTAVCSSGSSSTATGGSRPSCRTTRWASDPPSSRPSRPVSQKVSHGTVSKDPITAVEQPLSTGQWSGPCVKCLNLGPHGTLSKDPITALERPLATGP